MGILKLLGWVLGGILTLIILACGGALITLIWIIALGIIKLAIIGAIFFGIGGALLASFTVTPKDPK